jgi:hypothetical protein
VASGATIGGTSKRLQTNTNWEGFGWVGRLGWWLAVSVSTLVVGLVLVWLVGRGAARILEAGRTRIGPSIGWGLLVFFGLPILAVIALVTVVGIPLGLGLLAALLLIYALGYSAAAWVLGRSIVRGPTAWVVAFLVGWAILRVVALVPILGGLVWFAAVVFGLGARGGYLASPQRQPSRSSSRLTDPVPGRQPTGSLELDVLFGSGTRGSGRAGAGSRWTRSSNRPNVPRSRRSPGSTRASTAPRARSRSVRCSSRRRLTHRPSGG